MPEVIDFSTKFQKRLFNIDSCQSRVSLFNDPLEEKKLISEGIITNYNLMHMWKLIIAKLREK